MTLREKTESGETALKHKEKEGKKTKFVSYGKWRTNPSTTHFKMLATERKKEFKQKNGKNWQKRRAISDRRTEPNPTW